MIKNWFFVLSGLVAYAVDNRKDLYQKMPRKYSGYKVFEVIPENTHHLKVIKDLGSVSGLDVWSSSSMIEVPTIIMVPPNLYIEFLQFLDTNNIRYVPLIHDVQRTVDRERVQQLKRVEGSGFNTKDFNVTPLSFHKYHRIDTIEKYLKYLEQKYPHLVQLTTIGKSFEGRNLNVLKISSGLTMDGNTGKTKSKPAILIEGGMHAREWISPATVLYLIFELVENYNHNKDMVKDIDWYMIPCINPDGYEYSHTHRRLWRKSRSKNQQSTCWGTDLNRNFDFHWLECDKERNMDPCSATYAGSSSFSEPELISYAKFAMKIRDNLKLYISLHSFGQYILYPWGYAEELPDNVDELEKVAQNVKKKLSYRYIVGNSTRTLYPASGTSDDWFKGVVGVDLVYTIELPGGGVEGFDLPPDKIKKVGKDTLKGMRVFAQCIQEKYIKSPE